MYVFVLLKLPLKILSHNFYGYNLTVRIFISLFIAVVSFESTGGSGDTIQVSENAGALEVVLNAQ